MGTDRDWEKWGATDPYFGVLSLASYRRQSMDSQSRESFFRTGAEQVERVLGLIEEHLGSVPQLSRTLDFGCGVGRIAIPLARRSAHCTAVDISPSMLAEATRNAAEARVENVEFIRVVGDFHGWDGQFSLVHSYIVLQHIPWRRGRHIIRRLAANVAADGVLAAQFLTSSSAPKYVQLLIRARYVCPPLNWVRNLLRRRPMLEPAMQLHIYDRAAVSRDLATLGFQQLAWCADPDVGEFSSVLLLARRASMACDAGAGERQS